MLVCGRVFFHQIVPCFIIHSFHHAICHHHKQPKFPGKNVILTNSALYSAPRRDELLRHTVNVDAEEFMNFKRTLC